MVVKGEFFFEGLGGCLRVKGVGECRALVGPLGLARAVVGALKTFNSFNSLKTFIEYI